jgi:hypothetical protein
MTEKPVLATNFALLEAHGERDRLLAGMTEEERKELDEFMTDRDQGEDVERDWP